MKNSTLNKRLLILVSAVFSLAASFSAMAAAPTGALEGADGTSIYGWTWESGNYNHVIPVEISIYPSDSLAVLKTVTVKADHYQEKLHKSIGDGYHGFRYSLDWNQFEQTQLRVAAYAVTETDRVFLGGLTFHKGANEFVLTNAPFQEAPAQTSAQSASEADVPPTQGPGEALLSKQAPARQDETSKMNSTVSRQAPVRQGVETVSLLAPGQARSAVLTQPPAASPQAKGQASANAVSTTTAGPAQSPWQTGPGVAPKKEAAPAKVPVSLGMFTVTGYCNCDICCPSSTSKLTYSETQPQPKHTLSADINQFPIGTRLRIGDVIYTVEDIGSNVVENRLDIYYATHEEALAHGTTTEEVFSVPE